MGGSGELQAAGSLLPAGGRVVIAHRCARRRIIDHHHSGLVALLDDDVHTDAGVGHGNQFIEVGGSSVRIRRSVILNETQAHIRRGNDSVLDHIPGLHRHRNQEGIAGFHRRGVVGRPIGFVVTLRFDGLRDLGDLGIAGLAHNAAADILHRQGHSPLESIIAQDDIDMNIVILLHDKVEIIVRRHRATVVQRDGVPVLAARYRVKNTAHIFGISLNDIIVNIVASSLCMNLHGLPLRNRDTHDLVGHISLHCSRNSAYPLSKVDRQFIEVCSAQYAQIDFGATLVQQVEDHIVLCRRGTLQKLHRHIHILPRHVESMDHAVRHDHMRQFRIDRVKGHLGVIAGLRLHRDRCKLILHPLDYNRGIVAIDGAGRVTRGYANGGLVVRVIGTIAAAGHYIQSDIIHVFLLKPHLNDHMVTIGGHVEGHGLVAVHGAQVRIQNHQAVGGLGDDLHPIAGGHRDIQCNVIIPLQTSQQSHTGLGICLMPQKSGIADGIAAIIQHPDPGSQIVPHFLIENGNRDVVIGHGKGVGTSCKGIKGYHSVVGNLAHLYQVGGILGVRLHVQGHGLAYCLPDHGGAVSGGRNAAHTAGKVGTAGDTAHYQSGPVIVGRQGLLEVDLHQSILVGLHGKGTGIRCGDPGYDGVIDGCAGSGVCDNDDGIRTTMIPCGIRGKVANRHHIAGMEGFQLSVSGTVALRYRGAADGGADGGAALCYIVLQLSPEVIGLALLVCNGNGSGQCGHIKFVGSVGIEFSSDRCAAGGYIHRHRKAGSGIRDGDLDHVILLCPDLLFPQVVGINGGITCGRILHGCVVVVRPGGVVTSIIEDLQSGFQPGIIIKVNMDVHIIVLHDKIQIAVGEATIVLVGRIGVNLDIHNIIAGIRIDPGPNIGSRRGSDRILVVCVKFGVALSGVVMKNDVCGELRRISFLELHCHTHILVWHLKADGHAVRRAAGGDSHIVPGHGGTGCGGDPLHRISGLRHGNNGHLLTVGNNPLHIAAVAEGGACLVRRFGDGSLTGIPHPTGTNGSQNQEIAVILAELHRNGHIVHRHHELALNVQAGSGILLPGQSTVSVHSHDVGFIFRIGRQNGGKSGKHIPGVSLEHITVIGGHPVRVKGSTTDIVGIGQLHPVLYTVWVNDLQPHFPFNRVARLENHLYGDIASRHGEDRCVGSWARSPRRYLPA